MYMSEEIEYVWMYVRDREGDKRSAVLTKLFIITSIRYTCFNI